MTKTCRPHIMDTLAPHSTQGHHKLPTQVLWLLSIIVDLYAPSFINGNPLGFKSLPDKLVKIFSCCSKVLPLRHNWGLWPQPCHLAGQQGKSASETGWSTVCERSTDKKSSRGRWNIYGPDGMWQSSADSHVEQEAENVESFVRASESEGVITETLV